jgi:hypothetical protein
LFKGPQGHICFQWVSTHCSLLGNKRAGEEAKRAAGLGLDNGTQRGRISFKVVKGLIQRQVKDEPPKHVRISQVYSDGFRRLHDASRREEVLLAQLRGGCSLLTVAR